MELRGKALAHDAALLLLAALTTVCAEDPKAGRRARRHAIRTLEDMPAHPAVRAEAIRGLERSCGACRRCRGV